MLRILAGLATAFVLGCTDLLGPHLPEGAVPLVPIPDEYQDWWSLSQRCSGLQQDFSEIRWYTVPESKTIPGHGDAAGLYVRGRRQIVLAADQERNGFLVRHEMLHALQRSGGHPRGLFLERCGGVVSCSRTCQDEAGESPTWDLTSPLVPVTAAEVTVDVFPSVMSLGSATRGCVTIVASANNRLTRPITLDVRRGDGFSWGIEGFGGGSGGGPILRDSLIAIAPGEGWSYAFDCPRRVAEGLAPGDYSVHARLEYVQSESVLLRVIP